MTKDEALLKQLDDLASNNGSAIYEDAEICGEAAAEIRRLRKALAKQPAQQEPADIFVEVALSNRWPCAKKGAGV